MRTFLVTLKKELTAKISLGMYLVFSLWWGIIFFSGNTDSQLNHLFGLVYGGFALWGGMLGLVIGHEWGGLKSLIGRSIYSLAAGLLLQTFGQYSFWYLNSIAKIAVPYPGIPDIGFFGSIPLYIYAAYLLAKSSGAKVTLKLMVSKVQIVLIPSLMLGFGYFLFLRNYEFDWANPLIIFLDYGYPLGQAIYISIAVLTYTLSRKILGGLMRFPILFLIIAFMAQFLSDYTYIYFSETYFPGSFIDFFYLTAYFLMSLGLIQLKVVIDKLRS